jgi:hypothetical protein
MYGSRSFNHARTIDHTLARRASYSAQSARLAAMERETDRELRAATRGTWLEIELETDTFCITDRS